MSGIKVGDLVMVVGFTRCCKKPIGAGITGKVVNLHYGLGFCVCGHEEMEMLATLDNKKSGSDYRLKKIDPPSTGEYDRVPVRKNQPKKVMA